MAHWCYARALDCLVSFDDASAACCLKGDRCGNVDSMARGTEPDAAKDGGRGCEPNPPFVTGVGLCRWQPSISGLTDAVCLQLMHTSPVHQSVAMPQLRRILTLLPPFSLTPQLPWTSIDMPNGPVTITSDHLLHHYYTTLLYKIKTT